jgi:tetratricopeptide (TPR) repeat protein
MGIFRLLLKAIFGGSKKKPSKNRHAKKPKESIEIVIAQAKEAASAINDSINTANQSKELSIRKSEIKKARDKLAKLKNISTQYPFITLSSLQETEDLIIKVEAETLSLSSNRLTKSAKASKSSNATQRLSERDEDVAVESFQTHFKVINESIGIARKSKNLETQLSRLRMAEDVLKRARVQASQFSIDVDGLDEAEAEINRIHEAIRAGTPIEIAGMQPIDVDAAYSSVARNLLMEATALKKEKKYIEACEKLREAYSADGADDLFIEDRVRLPMYLQLAGKNDEGWDELNRLLARYADPRIENQMKIFLRKEKNETASNPVRVILRSNNDLQQGRQEPQSITIDGLQNAPMPSYMDMDDIVSGFEFCATLQLRTPLRVLLRHGEHYLKNDGGQPQIAREPWEGIWVPKLKTWEDLGITGIDEFPDSTMASDIGAVRAEDYLPFLIAVREIVELEDSIENRIKMLREKPMEEYWQTYLMKCGGINRLIGRFFPRFIDTIPNISDVAIAEFARLGLDTPNRIAAATDETLLGIKGIGQVKLKTIRDHCAGITDNRDNVRFENVRK